MLTESHILNTQSLENGKDTSYDIYMMYIYSFSLKLAGHRDQDNQKKWFVLTCCDLVYSSCSTFFISIVFIFLYVFCFAD